MTVVKATWGRVVIVLVASVLATAAVSFVVNPSARRAPAAILADTSKPLAPPPPGFPALDGFADVSADHQGDNQGIYPLATFTSPTGLQCAMWSSLGDTAAYCFGPIPGVGHPANQVYAGDREAHFDQNTPPAADKLNGRPLASGQKVVLGAGGNLMGGDQITCGVQDVVVACVVIGGFSQNHGDASAPRHGFVIDPRKSWTF